jgi:hypothetical protein
MKFNVKDKDSNRKNTKFHQYDGLFNIYRAELLEQFEHDEGTVEDYFTLPFEVVQISEKEAIQNKKNKIKGNTLANFEEQNALINRFKIE